MVDHVPQYDGILDLSITGKDGFNIITSNLKYCEFCDEDFMNLVDFSVHMKLYNFMCNNCLDYYAEKPWFNLDDFTFTRNGAVPRTMP